MWNTEACWQPAAPATATAGHPSSCLRNVSRGLETWLSTCCSTRGQKFSSQLWTTCISSSRFLLPLACGHPCTCNIQKYTRGHFKKAFSQLACLKSSNTRVRNHRMMRKVTAVQESVPSTRRGGGATGHTNKWERSKLHSMTVKTQGRWAALRTLGWNRHLTRLTRCFRESSHPAFHWNIPIGKWPRGKPEPEPEKLRDVCQSKTLTWP